MAWACRDRQIKAGELPEHDPRGPVKKERRKREPVDLPSKVVVYDKDALIGILKDWSAKNGGGAPRVRQMKRPELPSRSTFIFHFGSWEDALRAAGIDPNRSGRFGKRPMSIERKRIIDALRKNGPLTSAEIAVIVGSTTTRSSHLISNMRRDGALVVAGTIITPGLCPLRQYGLPEDDA